ncbi:hypothetical protein JCM13304A_17840 [Desulfothermus okinawensis JCM 13304]
MEKILNPIKRQLKALDVLYSLQREEYKILLGNRKSELSKNQFAIQGLISQLKKEKEELLTLIQKEFGVNKLLDLAGVLEKGRREELVELIDSLKAKEKLCMEQATRNADLAIAHLEQTRELVNFLYDQIRPKSKDVYSKYGKFTTKTPGPCIVSGRL